MEYFDLNLLILSYERNPKILKYLYKNKEELIRELLKKDVDLTVLSNYEDDLKKFFDEFPKVVTVISNEEKIELLKRNLNALHYLKGTELRYSLIESLIYDTRDILDYLTNDQKNSWELMLKLIEVNENSYSYIGEDLKNLEFLEKSLKRNSKVIDVIHIIDSKNYISFSKKIPILLNKYPKDLIKDKDLFVQCIKEGLPMEEILVLNEFENFQKDLDILKLMIQYNRVDYLELNEELQNNEEIITIALLKKPYLIQHESIPIKYRTDLNYITNLIEKEGEIFLHLPENLKSQIKQEKPTLKLKRSLGTLSDIPPEVFDIILQYIPFFQMMGTRLVCKSLLNTVDHSKIWKFKYRVDSFQDYKLIFPQEEPTLSSIVIDDDPIDGNYRNQIFIPFKSFYFKILYEVELDNGKQFLRIPDQLYYSQMIIIVPDGLSLEELRQIGLCLYDLFFFRSIIFIETYYIRSFIYSFANSKDSLNFSTINDVEAASNRLIFKFDIFKPEMLKRQEFFKISNEKLKNYYKTFESPLILNEKYKN